MRRQHLDQNRGIYVEEEVDSWWESDRQDEEDAVGSVLSVPIPNESPDGAGL